MDPIVQTLKVDQTRRRNRRLRRTPLSKDPANDMQWKFRFERFVCRTFRANSRRVASRSPSRRTAIVACRFHRQPIKLIQPWIWSRYQKRK